MFSKFSYLLRKKVRKYNILLLLKEFEEAKKFVCCDVSIFWVLAQGCIEHVPSLRMNSYNSAITTAVSEWELLFQLSCSLVLRL